MRKKLQNIKVIAADLDGVVYLGDSVIPEVPKTLRILREHGYRICYVTNNSAKNAVLISEKLQHFDIDCSASDVYCSAEMARRAVVDLVRNGRSSIYIVGSNVLKKDILSMPGLSHSELNPDILLIGLDVEFNYTTLSTALLAARTGAYIIACNREKNYPDSNGVIKPGCGPIVSAIETACGRKADLVVGKPELYMLKSLCEDHNVTAGDILVVGDSPESDISMANAFGAFSVLCSSVDIKFCEDNNPDYVLPSLNSLPKILN